MVEKQQARKIRNTGIGAVLPPEDRAMDQIKNKKSSTEDTNFEKEVKTKEEKDESKE